MAYTTVGKGRVAHYRIERELGSGGQAVVYLAHDLRLERAVALKVLSPERPITDAIRRRFRREARVASRLSHPGICPVYDAGTEGDVLYIAMPFIVGETLAARVRTTRESGGGASRCVALDGAGEQEPAPAERPGDVRRVVEVIEKAARALHAAHEAGVIHRDLKPGNIMVTRTGEPVIMDFGLARDEESFALLTRTGDWLGTPTYMSPEQVAGGHHLDRRTDVYSLGATLYECLTLRPPLEAPSREALFEAILKKAPPDPRGCNPRVSRDLKVVLDTALEKDPGRRYQTALDLAEELRRVRESRPVRARPPGPLVRLSRWARRNPAVAAGLSVVFVALAAGLAVSLLSLRSKRAAFREEKFALGSATEERARALELGREARSNLDAYERLADVHRLDALLKEAGEDLWPAWPEKVPAMEDWLQQARELARRAPLHVEALRQLEAMAVSRPDAAGGGSWVFKDMRDQWRHDVLSPFVAALAAFADPGARRRSIREVELRKDRAETIRKRSIDDHREAWDRAIRAVEEDPRTRGLRLVPQIGLVPLGADPGSGLQEFCDLGTGEAPRRDPASGLLRIDEGSGIVLVLIPGGTVLQGSQSTDPAGPYYAPDTFPDEGPVHEVRLDPFFLSKYEMTQGQWVRFTGENPSSFPPGGAEERAGHITLLHPVESVSWSRFEAVLRRLGMELPTEAQWERGCRGGTATPFWTGSTVESLAGAANLAQSAVPPGGAGGTEDTYLLHAPVGRFRPNFFGLHDVHGNVQEWCRDIAAGRSYDQDDARPGDGLREPLGLKDRALRGSSFVTLPLWARSSWRGSREAGCSFDFAGVRPARRIGR